MSALLVEKEEMKDNAEAEAEAEAGSGFAPSNISCGLAVRVAAIPLSILSLKNLFWSGFFSCVSGVLREVFRPTACVWIWAVCIEVYYTLDWTSGSM